MKAKLAFFLLVTLCSFIITAYGQGTGEKRIALVIGNSAYGNGQMLKNPVNDANLMASTLQKLGFTVIKVLNSTKVQMDEAILSFSRKLSNYNIALFFYAGHGIQVNGVNYLIPTDAKLEDQLSAQFQAVDVSKIVAQFELYPDNTNILVLDACRNNPFRSWMRDISGRGLKAILTPSGTLIAFATSEGSTASDGAGMYGLFTQELVKQMIIPQSIETVFKKTRVQVEALSNNSQSPQEWTKLRAEFYFINNGSNKPGNSNPGLVVYEESAADLIGSVVLNVPTSGKLSVDNNYFQDVTVNKVVRIGNLSVGEHTLEISGDDYWRKTITINDNKPVEIGVANSNKPSIASSTNKKGYLMGEFPDSRDGIVYKTIRIGEEEWMAENLNHVTEKSVCLKQDPVNCKKFGRLYSWEEAKINCPSGWHLPCMEEWIALLKKLNNSNKDELFDKKGFNAVHGGRYMAHSNKFVFSEGYVGGKQACFWTSSKSENGIDALLFEISSGWLRSNRFIESTRYIADDDSNDDGLSVRCIRNK